MEGTLGRRGEDIREGILERQGGREGIIWREEGDIREEGSAY